MGHEQVGVMFVFGGGCFGVFVSGGMKGDSEHDFGVCQTTVKEMQILLPMHLAVHWVLPLSQCHSKHRTLNVLAIISAFATSALSRSPAQRACLLTCSIVFGRDPLFLHVF